jgi:enamine deaminase RidA (YjgF/YER057c/UK114 family)
MTELCERTGVRLLAYGTLAGGLLTEKWLGAPEPALDRLATWSQMKYARFVGAAGGWARFQRLLQTLSDVARRRGVSIASVATRYVLEQPAVGAVIVGARLGERDHIADTLRVFSFELSAADRDELDGAAGGLESLPGDCGDEYRKPPILTASGDLSHHFDDFPAPYPTHGSAGGRIVATSGTRWEAIAGYGRAVRLGNRVLVSGTTATHGDRLVGGTDPAAQTHFAIDKIEGALRSLGATLADVVRTRIYVTNPAHAEAISRAHGERFREILPANTLIRADLVGDGYLVEIEAEAEIRPAS